MTEQLPAEVRDRAIKASRNAYLSNPYSAGTGRWDLMVDAVAEVITEHLATEPLHEVECPSCGTTIRARMADSEHLADRCPDALAKIDALWNLETRDALHSVNPELADAFDELAHCGATASSFPEEIAQLRAENERLKDNVYRQINRRRDEHSKVHEAVAERDKLRERNESLWGLNAELRKQRDEVLCRARELVARDTPVTSRPEEST
jgi:hypothetical protein